MKKEIAGESKVYSEFFTNLAVAWISGGIITPLFSKPRDSSEVILYALWGVLGALFSLKLAVVSSKGD